METLEDFARLRAAIEREGDRDRVLRAAGLAPADWTKLQRRWLDALAEEIESGRDTLASRYCEAFAAATATTPALETGEDAPPVSGPMPVVAVAVPSYLQPAASAPPAASPRLVDLRGTAMALDLPPMPALPFKDGTPTPVAVSAPVPKPPSPLSGTVLALDVPRGPATPFDSAPGLVETVSTAGEPSGPITPFEALDAAAMGFGLMRYAELVAARSAPQAVLATVLQDFGIDAESHARIEAYWKRKFERDGVIALEFGRLLAQAKKPRAAPPPASSAPFGTGTVLALDVPKLAPTPFEAAPEKGAFPTPGATTELGPALPAGRVTPFQPTPPEAHGFNLTRYCELVAARGDPGADIDAVLAEFSIDADTHARVEAYWRRKFEENGLLALEFGRLHTQAKQARAGRKAPRTAAFGTGTSLAVDVPRNVIPFAAPAREAAPTPDAPTSMQSAPPAPAAVPELRVEQYAWVVAALRKTTDEAATLARLRLTPETRKELEARWAARMAADSTLREAFLNALTRHLAGEAK